MGMLLARTNPDAPKHQGITWFAIDMRQPGVEIRPLKEMTGHAMFNEVFLTDAEVHDDDRIGDVNNGWAAANTTLLHERSGMGSRGAGAGPESAYLTRMARAGSIAGDLDKRAGDFVTPRRPSASRSDAKASTPKASPAQSHIDLAREMGVLDDPTVRQRIVHGHILLTLTRLNTERNKASAIPGIANLGKLLMGHVVRHNRDLGMAILGARGMLHSYDDEARGEMAKLPGGSAAVGVTAQALGAQALPIYGGTDQVQKNIVGERVLGLPKEPGDLTALPFSQLPKNA
jgi:alkylation response protein AidB-like acyl-CoA dehydrogenase